MTIIYVCTGILVISFLVFAYMVYTAPAAYEDESGFHIGEPPEKID